MRSYDRRIASYEDDEKENIAINDCCFTFLFFVTIAIFVSSIFGIVDAWNETSTKKAEDLEVKID